MTTYKPKLIEVALPLAAINAQVAAEGSIGQRPHPKNLHRWWARRPLAAARAVLWSSLVDDPSGNPALSVAEQADERGRLFWLLEALVQWDGNGSPAVLREAQREIEKAFPDGAPVVIDPFGGGGAIPLEAQRLGMRVRSGDLNPLAVLIQRAMLELPQHFYGRGPVHPDELGRRGAIGGAEGIAADVLAYGRYVESIVKSRLGDYYRVTGSGNATPVAWIWARTVKSPDPTWKGHVPLVASWLLSSKKGKPKVWIEPRIDRESHTISYAVRRGGSPSLKRTVDRGKGTCLATGAALTSDYLREQAVGGLLGADLMAVVVETPNGRDYMSATLKDFELAGSVPPAGWLPSLEVPSPNHDVDRLPMYGMPTWADAFTVRQQAAMSCFVEAVAQLGPRIEADAVAAGILDDGVPAHQGGSGARAYADALRTYLAFAVDKLADFNSTLVSWNAPNSQLRYVFSRQAIAMTWDFAEVNPLSGEMGSWNAQVSGIARALESCLSTNSASAVVQQMDATAHLKHLGEPAIVCTDPPYYDNISYADVSDYFWVWIRRSLADVWPDECATLLTPKSDELIANPYRAGSKALATAHFEGGMAGFMKAVAAVQHPGIPATVFYAYKATETVDGSTRSTGWATFLEAVVGADLQVVATWPMRTERQGRLIDVGSNALASSIVLACRLRGSGARLASRGEFVEALRSELPEAVRLLQSGNIAPVDMAQSTIGPGIKVFSRYAKVVEADGSSMSVSDALAIINDVLGDVLDGEEAELDRDTRFAVTWYTQHGYNPGRSGDADAQARAKNTSLAGIQESGVGEARGGKFRLFERSELDPDWDPVNDVRRTVWEATQHLVAALDRSETEAAVLLHRMGGYADRARQLAYVLFQRATDKGWAEEAGAYNGLITAWPSLQAIGVSGDDQQSLL